MVNTIKILIVDDDLDKSSMLIDIIASVTKTEIKKEIELRTTFDSGIKCLKESLPDLLILDMQFPKTGRSKKEKDMGALFLKQMKSEQIKVDTIVCSYGYSGYKYIKENNCEDMIKCYISADSFASNNTLKQTIENIDKIYFVKTLFEKPNIDISK